MQKRKILIAQCSVSLTLTVAAADGFDVALAADFESAEAMADIGDFDLFLIGIHFDESRAIDLVSYIRANQLHKDTPIILIRLLPTSVGDSLRLITSALKKANAINEYLELENAPDATAIIRHAVQNTLG